jgi:antitoxin FitA
VPSLLIRNVDATLHARLKARAAAHRRSLEEEVRDLLRTATARQAREENVVDVARRLFGPQHGVNLGIPPRGSALQRPPPDFSSPDNERLHCSIPM